MQDFIGMKRGLVVTGMQVSFLGETKGNNFWGYGNGPYQYSSLLPYRNDNFTGFLGHLPQPAPIRTGLGT